MAGYVVGGVPVVLCYSPDQLARKFAYQALLIEEFTRAGIMRDLHLAPCQPRAPPVVDRGA